MPRLISNPIGALGTADYAGAGTLHTVQTVAGALYRIFTSSAGGLYYTKSSDTGASWSVPVQIFASTTITNVATWYDRWSGIAAGLIHVAYTGASADDTFYRTIDTENADALSTETVIFAGLSTAAGGALSITRAAGGNVYCKTTIDGGAEGGFYRLPNANVPNGAWGAARTDIEALATADQWILLPDLNSADNQDILAIFWDASADEISRCNYDDSANTWAETSISTGMVDQSAATAYPHFAAAVDLTNSQHVLIAWTEKDILNADLKCWTITASAITAKTDVVTDSTDDQGLAALGIDTGTNYWYAFYTGKTDGSETYPTATNLYMKVSTDSGTTWGAETALTTTAAARLAIFVTPRFFNHFAVGTYVDSTLEYFEMLTWHGQPRAQLMLGV